MIIMKPIYQVEDYTVYVPCPKSFATVLVFPTAGFPVNKILYDTVSTVSCGGKLGASSTPGKSICYSWYMWMTLNNNKY